MRPKDTRRPRKARRVRSEPPRNPIQQTCSDELPDEQHPPGCDDLVHLIRADLWQPREEVDVEGLYLLLQVPSEIVVDMGEIAELFQLMLNRAMTWRRTATAATRIKARIAGSRKDNHSQMFGRGASVPGPEAGSITNPGVGEPLASPSLRREHPCAYCRARLLDDHCPACASSARPISSSFRTLQSMPSSNARLTAMRSAIRPMTTRKNPRPMRRAARIND